MVYSNFCYGELLKLNNLKIRIQLHLSRMEKDVFQRISVIQKSIFLFLYVKLERIMERSKVLLCSIVIGILIIN